jgi:hypothetical protein
MDKQKLSPKEEALLAEARRQAARKEAPAAAPAPAREAKPPPTPAERLARLMEEERAQTLERKKKMRRYGMTISAAILALFALWLFRATRPRR